MYFFPQTELFKQALDFGEGAKAKDDTNSYGLGSAPKTPRRSPRQFLSSIAHDATVQLKNEEHDHNSSGQMSDSELLLFAVGGSGITEGRGSGKKQKIGDVQVPEMLFKDTKESKRSDYDEKKQLMNERMRATFDEKSRKMKTYLGQNLTLKQLLSMKGNLVKIRRGLLSPTDKTSDSFFICVGKCIEELRLLELAEICARLRTSLAHWIACRQNEFTQVKLLSSYIFYIK